MVVLALIGCASAAVLAYSFYRLHEFFYPVMIAPFFWGLMLGKVLSSGVTRCKCRNPLVAGCAGLLCGCVSYVAYLELENRAYRREVMDILEREGVPTTQRDRAYDRLLGIEPGQIRSFGELRRRAEIGITITDAPGGRARPTDQRISGVGMCVYWAIELLLIAGFAALLPAGAAKHPYCESCNRWYEEIESLGLPVARLPEARTAIDRRDAPGLAACITSSDDCGVLSLWGCSACRHADIRVHLEQITDTKHREKARKTLHDEMLTRTEAEPILQSLLPPGHPQRPDAPTSPRP